MIISILLIYLIIMSFYFFARIKRNTELVVYNNGQLIITFFKFIFILVFYLIGLRVLNLVRIHQVIDLNSFKFSFNLVLAFILILSLRKLILYFFKINWFKFHYVMMCETNFSRVINTRYKFFYYNIIYQPAYYTFKYLILVNILMLLCLFLFIIYDLYFNNLILNYSLIYLKYYSLFKIFYLSYKFMITKQSILLDYYSYNLIYPGDTETNIFLNYDDFLHKELMMESSKYSSAVILEKSESELKYIPKNFGNTAKMPYFKHLYDNRDQ